MASKSEAMSFQYFAICSVSSVLVVVVPFIKVKVLGRIGESAFAETGVFSCLQHALKPVKRLRQIGVVAYTGTQPPRQARLLRVNFPRMYVNHNRQSFFLHPLQSQARVNPRQ